MPICTYIDRFETPTTNKAIRELIDELQKKTGEEWECEERTFKTGFFGLKERKSYSLYKHIYGSEWQVINFYLDETEWSINPYVSVNVVAAYLVGLLAGLEKNEKHIDSSGA